MKLLKNNKTKITASRSVEIKLFSELTPEQQDKVIKLANRDPKLSEIIDSHYDEDIMNVYRERVEYLADELNRAYGIFADVKKLNWDSDGLSASSNWDLSKVLSTYFGGDIGNVVEYEIHWAGTDTDLFRYTSVDVLIADSQGNTYWETEIGCYEDTLASVGVDKAAIEEILSICNIAQEFIDNVWELIEDVVKASPDDEWIRDMLETIDTFEFIIDGDKVSYLD